jgi:hypothetical protein
MKALLTEFLVTDLRPTQIFEKQRNFDTRTQSGQLVFFGLVGRQVTLLGGKTRGLRTSLLQPVQKCNHYYYLQPSPKLGSSLTGRKPNPNLVLDRKRRTGVRTEPATKWRDEIGVKKRSTPKSNLDS